MSDPTPDQAPPPSFTVTPHSPAEAVSAPTPDEPAGTPTPFLPDDESATEPI